MTVLLTNNVFSTLSATLTSTATGLTVTDGSRFPAPTTGEYCYATLIAPTGGVEIVKVVSRIGNALGIVRAQEGTLAQAFPEGSRIELRITAATIIDAVGDYMRTATAAPTSGSWLRGDIVWNSEPSAGGFIGWVCISSGSPGTWKTFGVIST